MTISLANLNYKFKDERLLNAAMHHSSIKKHAISFERLEFLGDRVLGLVVAEYIYKNFNGAEGMMAKMHAAFVCADACKDIALNLGVSNIIATAGDMLKSNKTVLADAMEALLGAIFIDSDYKTVKNVILELWQDIFNNYDEEIQEPKTKLQEICQAKTGKTPVYQLSSVTGPDHDLEFTITLSALGDTIEASGHSKKEAETKAAKMMLKKIKGLTND